MNINKYRGSKKRARVLSRHFARSWRAHEKNVVAAATNFAYRMKCAHRCTGLLFIIARISHLATERSLARGASKPVWWIQKRFFFITASIFYISVFKAVQPFTFKVASTTTRLYTSIPQSVTRLIYRTWARAPGERSSFLHGYRFYAFMLFNRMIEYLRVFSYIASILFILVYIFNYYRKCKFCEKKTCSKNFPTGKNFEIRSTRRWNNFLNWIISLLIYLIFEVCLVVFQ